MPASPAPCSLMTCCSPPIASSRRSGWREGESAVLGAVGNAYGALGDLANAAGCYVEALAIDREVGWTLGQAAKLNNLGLVYFQLGQLEAAAGRCAEKIRVGCNCRTRSRTSAKTCRSLM